MTPQGYLNLGATESNALWYSPKFGDKTLIDGSLVSFTSGPTDAAGPFISLAGLPPWSVHDVFLRGAALSLVAWTDAATPAVVLSRLNGLQVNPANNDLWLGSVMIGPVVGTARCDTDRGFGRVWSVYNAFNQEDIVLEAGTTTGGAISDMYLVPNDGVTRPVFNDPRNNASLIIGRAGPRVVCEMDMNRRCTFNTALGGPLNTQHWFGVGWNSQNTISGFGGNLNLEMGAPITYEVQGCTEHAGYIPPPFQGSATAWALECQRWGHSGGEWNIPFNFRLLLKWRA